MIGSYDSVVGADTIHPEVNHRSAINGPFRAQWLRASDNELIKLVETSRTLCPVHLAASSPTYYNPVAREKWPPSSLLLPGFARS